MDDLARAGYLTTGDRRRHSWLRDSSITTKLATLVAVNVGILLILLALVTLCLNISSGVRAYVGGEGLWSKGQKDAVYYLSRYAYLYEQQDYENFKQAIAITLGDRKARLEMQKPEYDYAVVEAGFVEGKNAAEDVPNLIFLFRHFGEISYLKRAIQIWTEADSYIDQLIRVAEELHIAIQQGPLPRSEDRRLRAEIKRLNTHLTRLEIEFSSTLSEGARWIQSVLLLVILGASAFLLTIGLWMSWRISRQLRISIFRLREGADQVSEGNLTYRIRQLGRDELGQLASAFNIMIEHRQKAEQDLETKMHELTRSNEELEQFAYIASHDLQEPLRTVTSYTQLLLRRYEDEADEDAREFSNYITDGVQRMREMIDGLLSYSRVTRQKPERSRVDLGEVLLDVLMDLTAGITLSKAKVTYDKLPVVKANKALLHHVLLNLISNALKFHGGEAPRIHISSRQQGGYWQISVRDHGIGIDAKHAERIFVLFQRLHTHDKYEGSGLGLTLCRKIIERHGGRIWVEPADPGSVFHFTLPI